MYAVRTSHPAARKAEVTAGSMKKRSHAAAAKPSKKSHAARNAQAAKASSAPQHPAHSAKRRSVAAPVAPVTVERIHAGRHKATADDFVRAGKVARNRKAAPGNRVPVATSRAAAPVQAVAVAHRTMTTRRPSLASVADEASTPEILPSLYNKRGRLIVPAALKGSHEILVHQNTMADRDGLDRIEDDADLNRMRMQRLLVELPLSRELDVDDRLPVNRRYSRPWTAQFLRSLARAHYARFHTSLQVNSAVRTVEFQQHLMHINGNAAPAEGETASPHLTGQAVDIAKHGLSMAEIAWMRGYLLPLIQDGSIDVEEEFKQSCFHISVYKKYAPGVPRQEIAAAQHGGTNALAMALR
jgi:hypothetical protein